MQSEKSDAWVDLRANQRFIEMKKRLKEDKGKRMSLNLRGVHVRTLDALLADDFAKDYSDAIRKLIEEKAAQLA